ncbi:MAG: hypothetical protein HDT39_02660 [Lachnospiraceae bacterium]|nr:hypothetical protein [Lachnospiraceae bacterium]
MKLKTQGYFKEMLHGDESNPSIFDYIQPKANKNEEEIINYLKNGIVIVACGGVVSDIINPDNGLAGCPELKTDGIWVWSGDLAYYVKRYHLKLDEEFIETMRCNNWHIKEDLKIDYDDLQII